MAFSVLIGCACAATCTRPPASPAELAERTRQEADRLHDRAIALHGKPARAAQAARLHRASARLRPASDPRAYGCYADAADVLVAAHRTDRAREYMEESAEFALSRGDSLDAARSYAYAVLIAARQQMPQRVIALAARMQAVARSPTLPESDIDALTAQIATHVADAEARISSNARVPTR